MAKLKKINLNAKMDLEVKKGIAWSVHAFTTSGIVLGFLALVSVLKNDAVEMLDPSYVSNDIRAAISHHIVELARHGQCDAKQLRDSALRVVHIDC